MKNHQIKPNQTKHFHPHLLIFFSYSAFISFPPLSFIFCVQISFLCVGFVLPRPPPPLAFILFSLPFSVPPGLAFSNLFSFNSKQTKKNKETKQSKRRKPSPYLLPSSAPTSPRRAHSILSSFHPLSIILYPLSRSLDSFLIVTAVHPCHLGLSFPPCRRFSKFVSFWLKLIRTGLVSRCRARLILLTR